MKVFISTEALSEQGLTLKDFGVLLYYIGKGRGDIDPDITNKLWEKNLLVKEIDGYTYKGAEIKLFKNGLSKAQ